MSSQKKSAKARLRASREAALRDLIGCRRTGERKTTVVARNVFNLYDTQKVVGSNSDVV